MKAWFRTKQEYLDAIAKNKMQIQTWQNAVRKLEVIEKQLEHLDTTIEEYLGVRVKDSGKYIYDPTLKLAREIFSKYTLEKHISTMILTKYIGLEEGSRQALYIMRLQINKNKEKQQQYKQFLKYLEK